MYLQQKKEPYSDSSLSIRKALEPEAPKVQSLLAHCLSRGIVIGSVTSSFALRLQVASCAARATLPVTFGKTKFGNEKSGACAGG